MTGLTWTGKLNVTQSDGTVETKSVGGTFSTLAYTNTDYKVDYYLSKSSGATEEELIAKCR